MAKKVNLLRNRDPKREEASKTGWTSGFNVMSISPDLACQVLQSAGLTVYREDSRIFGPMEEAQKVLEILAENGDYCAQLICRQGGSFSIET